MPQKRWSDERLDDLAKVVHHNDGRLDAVENIALHAKEELTTLKENRSSRSRSRTEQFAIGAALLSPVVTLVVSLIYHNH